MPTSYPEYVSAWKNQMEEAYCITAETARKEAAWGKNTIMTSGCLAEISYLGTNLQPDHPLQKQTLVTELAENIEVLNSLGACCPILL